MCAESVEVADEVEFSNGDGKSPPFTLTCVSLNRPATMVVLYLDRQKLNDVIITTVLDNPVTTQYTNTLTVTQRRGGRYSCSVISVGTFTKRAIATIHVQSMFIKKIL